MANGELTQGFVGGMRAGLLNQQLEQQEKASKDERDLQRSLAKFQVASSLITNKNLPANVKLQAFNEGIVGAWNSLFQGGPGSALPDNLLSPLTEWHDGVSDYVKRGSKILTDKSLTMDQKLEGLRGIVRECEGDVACAPLVNEMKTLAENQMQADELRYFELLTSDNAITEDEVVEAATIQKRSPKAVLAAFDRRAKQKTEVGEEKKTPLRAQFLTQSKDFVTVRDAYGRVQAAGENPSAAGDIALIFSFMKMTDPNSVVRESEFATAQNAAGVPDRVRALYNRVLAGERLAPNTRKDFISQANAIFGKQLKSHMNLEKEFGRLAKSSGFVPEDIVVDFIGEARGRPQGQAGAAASVAPSSAGVPSITPSITPTGQRLRFNPQTGKIE